MVVPMRFVMAVGGGGGASGFRSFVYDTSPLWGVLFGGNQTAKVQGSSPCLARWRWKLSCPSMLVVPIRFVMAVGGAGASGFRSVVWASRGLITTLLGVAERPISPCVLFFGVSLGSAVGTGFFSGCVSSPLVPPMYSGSLQPILYGAARLLGEISWIYSGENPLHPLTIPKKQCDPKRQLLDEICCACLTVQKFRMRKSNMVRR